MKLIQIDNTLYIVEGENKYKVSEELRNFLMVEHLGVTIFDRQFNKENTLLKLINGLDISDIQHRIGFKEMKTQGFSPTSYSLKREAFLLPEKEEKERGIRITDISIPKSKGLKPKEEWLTDPNKFVYTFGGNKLYTIEQIEKAIEESDIVGDKVYLKQSIINNLTK